MRSVFSPKTWQQLTSKIWSWPEVLAAAVARVNIKPTTAFCTISREISQWISTATGNNGSQLQQPVVTLDIPVARRPELSVEMRKSLTLCCTSCPGSEFLSRHLKWPLPNTQPTSLLDGFTGSLFLHFMERTRREACRRGEAWGATGKWRFLVEKQIDFCFTKGNFHQLKGNPGLFFQSWGVSGQICPVIFFNCN